MKGRIEKISINQLRNYYQNPRHEIGNTEEDTLQKLFSSVGIQYMLNLAEDIQKNGLLSNQQIVVVFSDENKKYVVYEGNRRIAAIKLLLDPDLFSFLDTASVERAKKISQLGNVPNEVDCYVTDETEAFFIMERTHSGEDKGRGVKQWTSREKEAFKVRQSNKKKVSFLIDSYCKKYMDGFDITTILPFTTIERIFNNREIRKAIGLDPTNEQSFTPSRMKKVVAASHWINQEAASAGLAVTRLFNKARTIEDRLIPWLEEYSKNIANEAEIELDASQADKTSGSSYTVEDSSSSSDSAARHDSDENPNAEAGSSESSDNEGCSNANTSTGGSRNLPYFFNGLQYQNLDPNDVDSHGVSAVCRELQLFSDKHLVSTYPIASTFLMRSIIEQSIIYYSKKHCIQGQTKRIWEDIKDLAKLSKIIEKYNKNLANYITEASIRQYFTRLFGNYKNNVDPLNWVVHKPSEFRMDASTLIELPRQGLLTIVNYFLSD